MRSDASDARDDLRALRAELDAESLLEGEGIEELEASAERFDQIGDRLESPLLAPVRWLPVAGRQLSAATHQADAAATGLQAAADLGGELEVLVDRGLGSGPDRVATLREVAATVDRSRPTFADLDLGPGDALVAPLADARLEIEEALTEVVDGLDRTVASSTGFADFFEGPSDYLLLAANNAQMQNGQGMFLSAGILHVEDGRMDLGPMESLEKPPDGRARRCPSTPTSRRAGDGSTRTTTCGTWGSRIGSPSPPPRLRSCGLRSATRRSTASSRWIRTC